MPAAPEYIPGAPLYAREPLKFSGVAVAPGEPIPERPERVRAALWRTKKATHVAPKRVIQAAAAAGVTVVEPKRKHRR